jgi:arylsulfatase A
MVLPHNPFDPTPANPDWKDPSKRYADKAKYFKGMVEYIDKIVGKIMNKLKQTGLEKNTLVIFTGDNGTNDRIVSKMEGGSKVHGRKGYMTDWGTRVPFIAYWKGTSLSGKTNTDLLDFSDVLPTLEVAAGVHTPKTKIVDGRSFLPEITGKPAYSKPYVYMYYNPRWGRYENQLGVFARNKRYKLYEDGKFYDLKNDVKEQHPLPRKTLNKNQRKIREKLQNVLNQKPMFNRKKVMKEDNLKHLGH